MQRLRQFGIHDQHCVLAPAPIPNNLAYDSFMQLAYTLKRNAVANVEKLRFYNKVTFSLSRQLSGLRDLFEQSRQGHLSFTNKDVICY
jgi:hypothetical protein